MGVNTKETSLIDSIKTGDLNAAFKLLNKNVKHVANNANGNNRTFLKKSADATTDIYATLTRKSSSKWLFFHLLELKFFVFIISDLIKRVDR